MTGNEFGKILFAVDGSSHMSAAALSVASLARATKAEVILLHVITEGQAATAGGVQIPAWMDRIATVVGSAPAAVEVRAAPPGETAEAIVAVARELNVGLVALGSRGLSDLSGLFRGSVSHRVIALSDCPVLVMRYGVRRLGEPIRRILLAIAGGEDVPHALEAAMTIALATNAEVLVLHARYLVTGLDGWPFLEPDEYAEQAVVKVVRRLTSAGIHTVVHTPVAMAGVARTIAHEAHTSDADLVVIGSRRLSDLASLLLGGIDHDVVHISDRPVLITERADPLVPAAR
jgi:nucleotide-binding universal stress UspA family protein